MRFMIENAVLLYENHNDPSDSQIDPLYVDPLYKEATKRMI
jgi:hypothetical protein